jgi:glycosyltransferase involved in cell wall biosynthesis
MFLISHPTGNENSRQAALALAEAEQLFEFWTCLGTEAGREPSGAVQRWLDRILSRRALPAAVYRRSRFVPLRELLRHLAGSTKSEWLRSLATIDQVYRGLDAATARRVGESPDVSGVYGYEDGCLETFRAAERAGVKRIYELPMGYWRAWRRLLLEERERQPEWATTLQGASDSDEKLQRKDGELALAQSVIVASQFARETLAASPDFRAPVQVLPYGITVTLDAPRPGELSGPLKIAYVGALTQRKGISYLFSATESLKHALEVLVIGALPSADCPPLRQALKSVRWIPSAPHATVLEELRGCHVLVFPSLFEGFGLVILEALAQGVPVITTSSTGGADVLTDGVDGFVIPPRSSEAIIEKLELLIRDRARLAQMREAALATARRLSWTQYRRALAALCAD